MMRVLLSAICFCVLGQVSYAQDAAMIAIENTYRNAIVKIDVSSNTPVIVDGKNICHSEGTGFLISRSHVVTAAHVLKIDPNCGDLVTIVKSRKHNIQKLGKLLRSEEDVAVLETSPFDTSSMCSLVVSPANRFETRGYRYGIPDGLDDPDPESLTIGEEDNGFKPLVRLRPVATHRGDSGGPVLDIFKVVGLTKARHEAYPDLSFMIRSSVIYDVIKKSGINLNENSSDFVCNPAIYEIRSVVVPVDGKKPSAIKQRETNISLKLSPSIELSGNNNGLTVFTDIVNQSASKVVNPLVSEGSELTVSPPTKSISLMEIGTIGSFKKIDSVVAQIKEDALNRWWSEYIALLDKKRLDKCSRGAPGCDDLSPP